MPRDSAGNYSLVSGNPVESGEVVSSSWANNTMNDVALALSNSLDRNGRGGMLAPFRFTDGTNLLPGAAWTNETSTGFYRFDGGDLRVAVLTQDVMRWQTAGAFLWNETDQQWEKILTGGGGTQVPVNIGTVEGQTLAWDDTDKVWAADSTITVDRANNFVGINNPAPIGSLDAIGVGHFGEATGEGVSIASVGGIGIINGSTSLAPFTVANPLQISGTSLSFEATTLNFGINATLGDLIITGAAENVRVTNAGFVGIGTDTPANKLTVSGTGGSAQGITTEAFGGNASFNLYRANGTQGAPTAVLDGNQLGILNWRGYGDTALASAANIRAFAAENFTDTAAGSSLSISVTPLGTVASVSAIQIDPTGFVGIGTVTPETRLHVLGQATLSRTGAGGYLNMEWANDQQTPGGQEVTRIQMSGTNESLVSRVLARITAVATATVTEADRQGAIVFSTARGVAGNPVEAMRLDQNGYLVIDTIPTADPGVSGALWSSGGVINISP